MWSQRKSEDESRPESTTSISSDALWFLCDKKTLKFHCLKSRYSNSSWESRFSATEKKNEISNITAVQNWSLEMWEPLEYYCFHIYIKQMQNYYI